jgi:PKHD-type hydroxylase
MLLKITKALSAAQVDHCRARLAEGAWADGRGTAGQQSARTKRNLQIGEDSEVGRELGELILAQLGRNPGFLSAALPLKVFPPLFNRYDVGMGFGGHVDNAIRYSAEGRRYRTDVSCTLFLSDPADYDGGELVIEYPFGEQSVKLAAGDLVLYPASSVHRVEAVTRGSRIASFFWLQSMVRDDGQRRLLHDLDQSIGQMREALSDDHPAIVRLTSTYHNLIRMWADA